MDNNVTPLKPVARKGNEEVVAKLERWLQMAKDGVILSVGLIGERAGGQYTTSFVYGDGNKDSRVMACMLMELALMQMGVVMKFEEPVVK